MDSLLYVVVNDPNHDFGSENFYTYELINPSTSCVFYVGKGRDNRGWKHILLRNNPKVRKTNPHLYNTIQQIINAGQRVIVSITASFANEAAAFAEEQKLIQRHGRRLDGSGTLTNILHGGQGSTRDGISVDQYSKFGEFIATYKNAKEAARINGYPYSTSISSCCTGRESSYKGFLWCYSGQQPKLLSKVKPTYQWSLNGELVARYLSASEAARTLECDPSTIIDALHGHTRQALGFLWSYDHVTCPILRTNHKNRPVVHINTNTTYSTVSAAARATGHNIGHVSACCSGRRISIGEDQFHYAD